MRGFTSVCLLYFLCVLILFIQTLVLNKSFTYLLTYFVINENNILLMLY